MDDKIKRELDEFAGEVARRSAELLDNPSLAVKRAGAVLENYMTEYVRELLKRGVSREDIREALKRPGE